MGYVRLTDLWAQDGLASVEVAALEDAGFHPVIECDPRGPMHFYGWPLGSMRATTIWVPASELALAREFRDAPWESLVPAPDESRGLWGLMSRRRSRIYALWLAPTAVSLGVASATLAVDAVAATLGALGIGPN